MYSYLNKLFLFNCWSFLKLLLVIIMDFYNLKVGLILHMEHFRNKETWKQFYFLLLHGMFCATILRLQKPTWALKNAYFMRLKVLWLETHAQGEMPIWFYNLHLKPIRRPGINKYMNLGLTSYHPIDQLIIPL